jgi:hypothetical protein
MSTRLLGQMISPLKTLITPYLNPLKYKVRETFLYIRESGEDQ